MPIKPIKNQPHDLDLGTAGSSVWVKMDESEPPVSEVFPDRITVLDYLLSSIYFPPFYCFTNSSSLFM